MAVIHEEKRILYINVYIIFINVLYLLTYIIHTIDLLKGKSKGCLIKYNLHL